MNSTEKILQEVQQERLRQNQKWGVQNHNLTTWVAILTEEVGEVAKEAVDYGCENGKQDVFSISEVDASEKKRIWDEIQSERLANYREELIQTAAVAVQMIECLDRGA